MAVWSLEFKPEAERDLDDIDSTICRRIIEKLDWLATNFNSLLPAGLKGEFKEFSKLRVGDWRVFYRVDRINHSIVVCYIDRRDKAYKKKK